MDNIFTVLINVLKKYIYKISFKKTKSCDLYRSIRERIGGIICSS